MGVKELVIRTRQGEGMKKVRTNHERLTMGDMEGMKKVRTNHERLTMGDMEEMTVDISGALNLPLLALSLIYRSVIQVHGEAWQHLIHGLGYQIYFK